MAPRRPSPIATARRSGTPRETGLRLQQAPERLTALLAEHERLLQKIAAKKKAMARLGEEIEDFLRAYAGAQPLVDQTLEVDQEIHALFAELFAGKGKGKGKIGSKKARAVVREVYEVLQDEGILSPLASLASAASFAGSADFEDLGDLPPEGAGGFSARRPDREPPSGNHSLRATFRDLATALHPDKVRDEAEKARRTEIMKEISLAYQEGDLARLVDLKRTWLDGGAAKNAVDETARRCAQAEKINEALRHQLRELTEELTGMQHAPPVRMRKDLEREARGTGLSLAQSLAAHAQAELDDLSGVRDFVRAFRDGQMSLEEFSWGPYASEEADAEDEDAPFDNEADNVAFEAFVNNLFGDMSAPSPKPRAKKRPAPSRKRR